jgi:HEPN domain-containing protein
MSNELIDHINEHMPYIDEMLAKQNVPVHERFYVAGKFFVETAVLDSATNPSSELLKSDVYRKKILPLFSDWYLEKYGDLAKGYNKNFYLGIALANGQPIALQIAATTSEVVEKGKLSKMTFPDHLQSSENFEDLILPTFSVAKMEEALVKDLREQIEKVVALTRTINLDLNMASNLSEPAFNMAQGIWAHFEKAMSDILTLKNELASIACWEIHLAIEKSLKVLIHSKTGNSMDGHNLHDLINFLNEYESEIDSSTLSILPSEQDAIKQRYSEMIKQPIQAYSYYLVALEFVADIASRLEHKMGIKNGTLTIKMEPWAPASLSP